MSSHCGGYLGYYMILGIEPPNPTESVTEVTHKQQKGIDGPNPSNFSKNR